MARTPKSYQIVLDSRVVEQVDALGDRVRMNRSHLVELALRFCLANQEYMDSLAMTDRVEVVQLPAGSGGIKESFVFEESVPVVSSNGRRYSTDFGEEEKGNILLSDNELIKPNHPYVVSFLEES